MSIRFKTVALIMLLIQGGFGIPYATAEQSPSEVGAAPPENEIKITADKLISDIEAKYAEFIGNVRALYQSNIISGDRLKIFFADDVREESSLMGQDSIDRIVIDGHVIITLTFNECVTESEKAEYIAKNRTIVLSGGKPQITCGKNFISGDRITVNRSNNQITVESDRDKPVEARFHSPPKNGMK